MKKSKVLKCWMITLITISTLTLGIAGWGYINLKIDNPVFWSIFFFCCLGYLGSFELYRRYLWTLRNDTYIEMD